MWASRHPGLGGVPPWGSWHGPRKRTRRIGVTPSPACVGPLRSKELGKGGSYEYTFREPGQYDYYCTVHPFMKSGVTVE
ncbi:MAG: plastocyanin/azurin family copper-binding protein [Actinomycetota bacterium]|nr:plastocyanin/azurin family copper-binding protein [Actinomycetota bacterium]